MISSEFYDEGLPYYKRISYAKKVQKNQEWVEQCGEYIDRYHGTYTDAEQFKKYRLNYNIAKGRGEEAMKAYMNNDISLIDEGINPSDQRLKHYDILSSIYRSMVGEQQKRKLKAIAKDISGYNVNLKKKKNLELYQEYMKQNIVGKLQDEATQEIFQKYQIINPLDLAPEEQQQIQSEIDTLVKFKTPQDIDNYMNNTWRSPSETMMQKLLDWYINEFDLKYIKDEAFKHLILAGKAAVHQGIKNNKPFVELLNPEGFTYLLEKNRHFIGEAEWWKYEKYVSYSTAISELDLGKKDFERLKDLVLNATGFGDGARRQITGELPDRLNKVVATINNATDGAFLDYSPKSNTKEGQQFIGALYSLLGNKDIDERAVRLTDICYTAFAKVHYVRRKDKTGNLVGYWVGENYKKNPELDYDMHTRWVKEYWQCRKLGHASGLYFQKERVPFQNRSLTDPFKIMAPFNGVEYSRLFDNSPHVAPIDFGKPYQYEYNVIKNKIEELDRTNIGKVFVLPESYIPHDWSIGKFSKMLKLSKLAPINENADTLNPAIASQILKSVDLGNNTDIQGYLNRLQYIRQEAELAMSYSPSQLGVAPASMTATNNQQNIIQGSYKTEDLFQLHKQFMNQVLTAGVNTVKVALSENQEMRAYLLDSIGISMKELEEAKVVQADVMIDIINDSEKVRELQSFKNLLQPMIQNGLISSSDAIRIQFQDNPAELLNLAETAERKAQERQREQMERQEKMKQEEMQIQMQMAKEAQEFEKYKFDEEMATRRYVAEVDSQKFLLQNDVDRNSQNDLLQKAAMDNEVKREKIKSDESIAKEKLKVENEKVKVMKMKPRLSGT